MGVDHVLARLLSLLQEIGQERVIILGEFEVFSLFLDKALSGPPSSEGPTCTAGCPCGEPILDPRLWVGSAIPPPHELNPHH